MGVFKYTLTLNMDIILIYGVRKESMVLYREEQARITSYIPTTSGSATRTRDNYLNGGDASLIGATEGVLYAEVAAIANQTGRTRGIALSASNSAANRVVIFLGSASNTITGWIQASALVTTVNATVTDQTAFNKIALKYKSGDISLWINGTEVATSTAQFHI